MIIGVIWPSPKKNRKITEIIGLFDRDTHAKRVASTGVIQGDEASPKVPPIIKGVKNEGKLSSINRKSGPFGNTMATGSDLFIDKLFKSP